VGFETGGDRSFRGRGLEVGVFEEEGTAVEEQQLGRRADGFPFTFFAVPGGGAPLDGERGRRGDQREQRQRQDRDGEITTDRP